MTEYQRGLNFALNEIQEYRALVIKAYKTCTVKETARLGHILETKNTLSLLGTVESKIMKEIGYTAAEVYKHLVERKKIEDQELGWEQF